MLLVFFVWLLFTLAMTIDLIKGFLYTELILSLIIASAYLFLSFRGKVNSDIVRTFSYIVCGVPVAYLILLFGVTFVLDKYKPDQEWGTGAGMMALMVGVLHTLIFSVMFGLGYLLQGFAKR